MDQGKDMLQIFWSFNLHSGTNRHGREEMSSKRGICKTDRRKRGGEVSTVIETTLWAEFCLFVLPFWSQNHYFPIRK